MKYVWAVLAGLIISAFGIEMYVGENIYTVILPIAVAVLVSFIAQLLTRKINFISIFPALCIAGVYIYIAVQNIVYITIDKYSITSIVYFIIMLAACLKFRTIKQNEMFGIKTWITLEYEAVWDKTHKFGSIVISAFLPMIISLILWGYGWTRFWLGFVCVLLPFIIAGLYSAFIGTRYAKVAIAEEKRELKIQNEIEQGIRR